MKTVTSYKLQVTFFLLSACCFLHAALNAQIEKKELKLTPEIEKMVVAQIKHFLEEYYSGDGITDQSQLANLHIGKPIPIYWIVSDINKKLDNVTVSSVSLISDGEPLSLKFMDTWSVPIMFDEEPLFFGTFAFSDDESFLIQVVKSTIEHFHNYEHKDLIIGSVNVTSSIQGMDHLIIRKENQDSFVQIYDKATGEYFKNEYNLRELINHLRELNLRKKEARMEYFDKIANKSELEMTPEMTEMLVTDIYLSFKNASDEDLPKYGIENRSQLENLHLGKPIPKYIIVNENLTFTGRWQVPVMSNGEPVLLAKVDLADDGEYLFAGASAYRARLIHNYEHKDLIVGFLGTRSFNGMDYVIIRKENKDIFVGISDYVTREPFKHEYNLSDIINLIKQ